MPMASANATPRIMLVWMARAGFGIAAEGFHGLANEHADGEGRADTTDAHCDGGADCLGARLSRRTDPGTAELSEKHP